VPATRTCVAVQTKQMDLGQGAARGGKPPFVPRIGDGSVEPFYPQLTPEVKNRIFGENAARIFGIDIAAARQAIETDLLYKLRDDHNPPPANAAPL
jgi:hypothetical protein